MDKDKILNDGLNKIRQIVKSEEYKSIRVSKGDVIIKQHSKVTDVYWADMAHFSVLHTVENGKTLSLGDYHVSDNFFGEMEFFSNGPSPFSVVATSDVELIAIPRDKFAQLLLQDGHIAFWMNHRMSNIYVNTMQIAIERSLYPLKYNIIKDIIERHACSEKSLGHTYIYQEAQRFGCTERAYTRIIRELIDEGLVEKSSDNSGVTAVDIEALQMSLEKYYQ